MSASPHHASSCQTKTSVSSPKLKKPKLYHVIMVNDDYTPMEFVVDVLQTVFHMNYTRATSIMLAVHHTGRASCGEYAKDIAETKVAAVLQAAEREGHPLYCYAEPV